MFTNAKELEVDDLTPGMLCTVVRSMATHADCDSPERLRVAIVNMMQASRYDSLCGIPIRIEVLELPFVVVRHYKCRSCQPITLDSRAVRFKPITREYAEALKPKYSWWKFWQRSR